MRIRGWIQAGAAALLAAVLVSPGAARAAAGGDEAAGLTPPRWSGYVRAREAWDPGTHLTASLHRVRLTLDGALPGHVGYRVSGEYAAVPTGGGAATVSLRDAYVRWGPKPWTFTAGQGKAPFSGEELTSITALELADRPDVVERLAPKRQVGVLAEFAPAGGAHGALAAGLYNGEGQNVYQNRDSTLLVVARAVARPDARVTLAGDLAAYGGDSTRYGGEAGLVAGALAVRGEILGQHRAAGGRDDLGWFVQAGWKAGPRFQLLARHEAFDAFDAAPARRLRATTAGALLDLPGGHTRLRGSVTVAARGASNVRRGSGLAQVEVRF